MPDFKSKEEVRKLMSRTDDRLEKAAIFLKHTPGTVQLKMSYLQEKKGYSIVETLEALNKACDGFLLEQAQRPEMQFAMVLGDKE